MSLRASSEDRRAAARSPAAFTFWMKGKPTAEYSGAWMVDLSPNGGSCLVSAADAPAVGQRIELRPIDSVSPVVREAMVQFPSHANVLRVEGPPGRTRRVALRFDAPVPAMAVTVARRTDAEALPLPRPARPARAAPTFRGC